MKRVFEAVIDNLFGDYNESNYTKRIDFENLLNDRIEKYSNYGKPYFKGESKLNIGSYLKDRELNYEPQPVEKVFDDISALSQNLPNWNNPGTMINVIPSVNLASLASSNYFRGLNPNFAQDTYAGFSILSELEVVKYISDLIGWNYEKSIGVFTFGGKATNLYATKIALSKCDAKVAEEGCDRSSYFVLTSANAHPCHYEVCDWLGLGKNSCIEIPCLEDGSVDLTEFEEIIRSNLDDGKIFLGCNLNGGSTNELYVDPIGEIYQIIDNIMKDYELNYRPHLHVDSVIGWVFLFFSKYDFDNNPLRIEKETSKKIQKVSGLVRDFKYADSIGIDFHKTGFCPYISSLFVCKDRRDYYALSPKKYQSFDEIEYGNYNPYQTTLELTRSSEGAIAALVALRTMGIEGFQQIYARMIEGADYFRKKLDERSDICVINDDSGWMATLFVLKPMGYEKFDLDGLLKLDKEEQDKIKEYNVNFAKYVRMKAQKNQTWIAFTSSRSHLIPGTNVSFGTLKAYPMSVFFDKKVVEKIVVELNGLLEDYKKMAKNGGQFDNDVISDDMVYRKKN